MIGLMLAFLMTTAQDQAPTPPEQNQSTATKNAEPEKVCKKKVISTGQGITGLKSHKICKTKEEWDRLKSNR